MFGYKKSIKEKEKKMLRKNILFSFFIKKILKKLNIIKIH